jgi:2-(1,2-epoxy-1,2-dihydrophenyl)acetyl-CoA isomerase
MRPVLYDVDDGVGLITLNRPQAMNSLDTAAKEALLGAVRQAAEDELVRAVVLTGTGRAFCVGQDLNEHATALGAEGPPPADPAPSKPPRARPALGDMVREHYLPTASLLAGMAKPVVGAVNGIAAGAGASYAFCCDLRIVADTAGFNLAFTSLGLSCDTGASWTLPRLVGWTKAHELLFFPRTVPANEALSLGLATEVVPVDDVLPRALELARQLAHGPTLAYAAVRHALAMSATQSFDESLQHEAMLMQQTGESIDHYNAVQAFLAKRRPVFHGR